MRRSLSLTGIITLFAGSLVVFSVRTAGAEPLTVQIEKVPADGLVVQEISLGLIRSELDGRSLERLSAVVKSEGRTLPAQLIPAAGFGRDNYDATLLLQAPANSKLNASLEIAWAGAPPQAITETRSVSTSEARWTFDPRSGGPLPTGLLVGKTERSLPSVFNDRLIDSKIAAFRVSTDRATKLNVVSAGPVATVIRGQARYLADENGKPAVGEPGAIYDWYFFRKSPQVFVTAKQFTRQAYRWKEMHFLEWKFKNGPFKKVMGDDTVLDLTDKGVDGRYRRWAALAGEGVAVATLAGPVATYDNSSSYGSYLHVVAPEPWAGWDGFSRSMKGWLWAGETTTPQDTLAAANEARTTRTGFRLSLKSLDAQVTKLKAAANNLKEPDRSMRRWKIALAERAVRAGQMTSSKLAQLELPAGWHSFTSGGLGLVAEVRPQGFKIVSLYDLQRARELTAAQSLPLFTLRTHSPDPADSEVRLFGSHENWDDCRIEKQPKGFRLIFVQKDGDKTLLKVTVDARADSAASGWRWKLSADNSRAPFAIQNVDFPQITMASPGANDVGFYPRAAGVLQPKPVEKNFRAGDTYPAGYCTMQFMTSYSNAPGGTGLYVARHDPKAVIKHVTMAADVEARGLQMTFNELAENPYTAGNGFSLSGEGVWQLLHGDWYDAALIYKDFVTREASWYPALTDEGRADTPLWYRQLDTWATLQILPEEISRDANIFRDFLGVPIGVHWYHWNKGFFDNDYPYFEARDGVTETVAALKKKDIHVMPYVNGRIWDTRDRGPEDWQFTSKGYPNAVKEYKDGKLVLDLSSYNARESDGSKTVLATMCPATPLWQDTMAELAQRITNDYGTDGLYYDQITVSVPIPCIDATHGHPLGGGHWWVDGYHAMLQKIRRARRPGTILASEAMAESYMKDFDGYLSYSNSSDGQVPAFHTIYAGAIQLIGREYEAGAAEMDKSLPMKAGQQLVYGEQIGWLTPDILFKRVNDASRNYYKELVQVRHKINPYFYAGEMMRPPKLNGAVPTITADWGPSSTPDWSAGGNVTTDAILTGAWKKRGQKKSVLIFTNVTDKAVNTSFTLNPAQYGLKATSYRVSRWTGSNFTAKSTSESGIKTHSLSLPGHSTLVWEIEAS